MEQLGKLVLEKEQARSLTSTIGVDVKTKPSENLSVEPKLVDVKQETQIAALCKRVANLEREMVLLAKNEQYPWRIELPDWKLFRAKHKGHSEGQPDWLNAAIAICRAIT